MKTLGLIVVFLIPLSSGCQRSEEIIGEGGQSGLSSEVSAFDYSLNHFFFDTLYRSVYESYFLPEPPQSPSSGIQIIRQEVWVERIGLYPDPNEMLCRSFLTLPPRGGGYDPDLRGGGDTAGTTETEPMVMLNVGEHSMLGDGYTGILTIDRLFNDFQSVAIAYRRADGTQFGEFMEQVSPESLSLQKKPLILHLVKPRVLNENGARYPVAWKMLVKSIYPLGSTYMADTGSHSRS